MQYRRLGTNGPQVPVVGFGAWPIGGGMGSVDEKTAVKTVQAAIDQGLTLIDTAEGYKASESFIGKALREGYRERCFLATKVSVDFSPEGIRKAMENSLRAMGVDYVDLYQVHRYPDEYDVEKTMETMQRLQEEGKTRYIGVSNFRVDQMDTARKTAPFVSNQVNYNMFLRTIEQELVPHARKTGTGIMVHSTLAKGLLAGKYGRDHQFPPDDERSQFAQYQGNTMQQYLDAVDDLKGVASDKGVGMVELAVAWTLRLPEVSTALVGAKNPEQLEAPIRAGEVTLTEEEISRIERVLATHKLESLAPFRSQIV